jgi:very-short-patch-repair endonuclease
LLLTKEVEIILHKNINHYKNLGYDIDSLETKDNKGRMRIKKGTILKIKVEHLMPNSKSLVEVLCDYCKKEVLFKPYGAYKKQRSIIEKDCCNNIDCKKQKYEEAMFKIYGVTNSFQLEEVKNKIREYYLINYEKENPSQIEEIKRKQIETINNKYGVDNVFQSEEIKGKIIQTNFKKYGCKYATQNELVKNKTKQTCMDRYDTENPMKNEEIKNLAIINLMRSKYKNGTGICSSQQLYLNDIFKGKLNYAVDKCLLDIAFPENKIYVEYDGGGHDLIVKIGKISRKEFETKEMKRQYYLFSKGWKLLKIISLNDLLPTDDMLLLIFNIGCEYLNTNHSWIYYDIDNNLIKTSSYEEEFNFGLLKNINNEEANEI